MTPAVADRVFVRFAGVAKPAPADYAVALDGYYADLGEATDTLPFPPRRVLPVYETPDGTRVAVRPDPDRPTAGPLPIPLPGPAAGDFTGPAYLPLPGAGPDLPGLRRVAWLAAANSGGHLPGGNGSRPADGGPFADLKAAVRDWAGGLPQQVAQSVLQSVLTNAVLGGGGGGVLGSVLGGLTGPLGGLVGGLGPAAGTLGGVLGTVTAGAGGIPAVLGFVAGAPTAGGAGGTAVPDLSAGAVLSEIGGQVLKAWKVKDSDSMGEQLAHHFANKWKGHLKDPEAALKKLEGYFTAKPAPALFPAVRATDKDAVGNTLPGGAFTVSADGLPLGRETDLTLPKGVQVYLGGATVLTEGLITARVGTSVTQDGPLVGGSGTVFVNGKAGGTLPPPKPPPKPPASPAKADPPAAPSRKGAGGGGVNGKGGKDGKKDGADPPRPGGGDGAGQGTAGPEQPCVPPEVDKRRREIAEELKNPNLSQADQDRLTAEYADLDRKYPGPDNGEGCPPPTAGGPPNPPPTKPGEPQVTERTEETPRYDGTRVINEKLSDGSTRRTIIYPYGVTEVTTETPIDSRETDLGIVNSTESVKRVSVRTYDPYGVPIGASESGTAAVEYGNRLDDKLSVTTRMGGGVEGTRAGTAATVEAAIETNVGNTRVGVKGTMGAEAAPKPFGVTVDGRGTTISIGVGSVTIGRDGPGYGVSGSIGRGRLSVGGTFSVDPGGVQPPKKE